MYQFGIYITGGFKLSKRNITVLGGDKRSLALARMLAKDGENVTLYGFNEKEFSLGINVAESLREAINKSTIIIGPLPFSNQDNKLNTPLYLGEIDIESIFKNIKQNQILFGGRIPNHWFHLSNNYHVKLIDFFDREEFQVLNAIPTSEGAIQIAMEKMDKTLHRANVIVIGFGRIGRVLTKMLHGIGANVYVGTNSYADIAWIKSHSYHPILLEKMAEYLPEMDLIVNTIPVTILASDELKRINRDTIIIDLASSPGGVDFNIAEKLGIKAIWALGLPGKVAPISSASYIKETIYHMIDELEV